MKLSEMRDLLGREGITLTKSLGQNFLHDGNQLRRIVEAAELTRADRVLEIGPGLGPLTDLLLERAGEVLAIEKDARLVRALGERLARRTSGAMGSLHLVHDDALDFVRREHRDWSGWKLVANLPYSVASPLLVELTRSRRGPERMVVTLQLEVAQRLKAKPDDSDYGLLTVLVQLAYEPTAWFKIPANCFFPAPDVDSACVCLRRRPGLGLPDELEQAFVRIVKRSFSQRRKMMLKLLKLDWPERALALAFEQLALPAQTRAESVSPEQFVRLTRSLTADSPGE